MAQVEDGAASQWQATRSTEWERPHEEKDASTWCDTEKRNGCNSFLCKQLSKGTYLLWTHLFRAEGSDKTQGDRTVTWQVVFRTA